MSLAKLFLLFGVLNILLMQIQGQEDFIQVYDEENIFVVEVPVSEKQCNLKANVAYSFIRYKQIHAFTNINLRPGTRYEEVQINTKPSFTILPGKKKNSGTSRDVELLGFLKGTDSKSTYLIRISKDGVLNAQTEVKHEKFSLSVTNAPGKYQIDIFHQVQQKKISIPKGKSEVFEGVTFSGIEEVPITINFHDMELLDVLNYFSKELGITFIVNDASLGSNNLKSKITIINAKPIKNSEEAFSVLKSTLALQDIGLIRQGNLWKVVSLEQAVRSSHEVKGNSNIADLLPMTKDNDSVVTRIIPLEYANALKAVVIVKNLISRDGKINQADEGNIIVVTDYSSNIRKILQVLSAIDVPVTKEYIEIYSLHHIQSSQLEKIFASLFAQTQQKIVRIIPIPDKKLVVALADQWNHERIKEMLSQIDLPSIVNQEIVVYQVRYNLAEQLAKTCNSIYEKSVEEYKSVFYADNFTNFVVVRCSMEIYNSEILPLLKKLDVPTLHAQRFIYHLEFASARELAERLSKMYAHSSSDNKQPKTMIVANEQTNSLLISCTKQDYQEIHDIIKELDIDTNENISGDSPETYVIQLSHANAEEIATQLNQIYANTNTQGGQGREVADESYYFPIRIVANKTTNSLMLFCTPSDFVNIRKTISQIDIETRQVLIDINIVEAIIDDSLNMGVEWQFNDGNQAFGTNYNLSNLANRNKLSLNDVASSATGFQYTAVINDRYEVFANLFSGTSQVNVLSSPKIYTANNEEAKIIVGEEVPIITRRINNPDFNDNNFVQDFEYREVGLITKLTPSINNHNEVTIKVTQEISNIRSNAGQADAPIISKREITTHVRIKDGETVILGGLFDTVEETQISKVPILGDIPLIGLMFRSQTTKEVRKELLVFVTPKVINNTKDTENNIAKQSDAVENRRWQRKRRD